jgi:hypothetical protein
MSTPTPELVLEAVRKGLSGDKRMNEILKRWMKEDTAAVLKALDIGIQEAMK